MRMLIRDLISRLGGPTAVATTLGLGVSAVSNWSLRNEVPAAHRLAVWRLAARQKIEWMPPGMDDVRLVLGEVA